MAMANKNGFRTQMKIIASDLSNLTDSMFDLYVVISLLNDV